MLKIPFGSPRVRVRLPPPAPTYGPRSRATAARHRHAATKKPRPAGPAATQGSESASLASLPRPWRTLLVQPRLDPLFQELEELLYVEEGGRGIVVVVHQPVRVIGRVGSDVVDHES